MKALVAALRATAAVILVWPILGYPIVLSLLAPPGGRATRRAGGGRRPRVAIIIPTYNEAATIGRRLRNLERTTYPRELTRVIVVDSGSGDGTAAIAESLAGSLRHETCVIREDERRGKASAINRALDVIDRDTIAVVTDAPTEFEPETIERLVRAFDDPEVGAATGTFVVTGEPGWLQRTEASFWRVRNMLRAREAALDSTPFLSGELCAFRRNLVEALDEDTLADDMNVALQVRRGGHRIVIADDAVFSEPRSNALPEYMETKTRRATGGIQELIRFRDMVFGARYGWFGRLILPSGVLYYLPLRIPAAAVLAAPMLRPGRIARIPRPVLAAGAVAAIAGVARFHERLAMLALTECLMIQGWRRYLTGKMDVRWQQERRGATAATDVIHAEQ